MLLFFLLPSNKFQSIPLPSFEGQTFGVTRVNYQDLPSNQVHRDFVRLATQACTKHHKIPSRSNQMRLPKASSNFANKQLKAKYLSQQSGTLQLYFGLHISGDLLQAVETAANSTIWLQKCLCRWRSKLHPHFWTTPGIDMTHSKLAGLWEYRIIQPCFLNHSLDHLLHIEAEVNQVNLDKATAPRQIGCPCISWQRNGSALQIFTVERRILASRAYPVRPITHFSCETYCSLYGLRIPSNSWPEGSNFSSLGKEFLDLWKLWKMRPQQI